MTNRDKALMGHLLKTGIINPNTGKVNNAKIAKTGITVPTNGSRGRSNASGKNSTRNGK